MRTLSTAARRAAAEAALALGAFARDGDRLWLPAAVAPERLPDPDLPAVVLESGRLEELAPVERLLAWGESPRVAALRARWGAHPEVGERAALDAPLHEAVWHLPVAPPEVVARVADRAFGFELARERGWALAGGRWVADPTELEAHLRHDFRRAQSLLAPSGVGGPGRGMVRSPPRSLHPSGRQERDLGRGREPAPGGGGAGAGAGRWVVKAPFSAAGRERYLGAGPGDLADPRVRRRVERLFERHGRLLVEPWVERTADFGAAGLLTPGGVRLASLHRQAVDARGAFQRILSTSPDGAGTGLAPAERDLLEAAFHAAADALRAAGYAGPFGIDAYRWRRPGGGEAFHPLCEINPRLTFGLVARTLAERAAGMGREGSGLRMLPPGGATR